MKILAISDMHGECPVNIKQVCSDNKIEIIVSSGDFCSFKLRELFFKKSYDKKPLEKVLNKNIVERATREDISNGLKILEKLIEARLPIFIVTGNVDRKEDEGFAEKTSKLKNVTIVNLEKSEYSGLTFIGIPKSSGPENKLVKHGIFRKLISQEDYSENIEKLDKLFSENVTILISHNVPYNTKLDIIGAKAHKKVRGKHYGSVIARKLIDKHQPLLCICGHMHENQGIEILGKTTVVNSGFGAKGEYAIIDINKDKVNVKLVKGEKWK